MSKPRPTTPIAALPAETDALSRFDALRQVLSETHSTIPSLLAKEQSLSRKLGLSESAELQREFQDVVTARESAVRRRASSMSAIMELQPQLEAERAGLERQRQAQGVIALAEFRRRYDDCVSSLQALWNEGRLLSETLKVAVQMQMPTRVVTSVVDSVARVQPILSGAAAAVDATILSLSATVDAFDDALGLIGAFRQAKELDARYRALAQQRGGAPNRLEGLYEVAKAFDYFGMTFAAGTIIDRSMLPDGCLHRFLLGRNLRILDGPAVAAA
jgi:hypothetical protein